MISSSLQDMEGQYNHAIERAALLETELEDKRRLEEENQRLKDELRDAREEAAVMQSRAPPPPPDDEMTLNDLVVKRAPATPQREMPRDAPRDLRASRRTRRIAQKSTLEQIRSNMQQLQQRLQSAQLGGDDRSAIPRPRSRMSLSISASPGVPPSTPRPITPSRRSQSGIPVPTGGLSRSHSAMRIRPTSRAETPGTPAQASPAPYGFMEHDPATPTTAMRRSQMARRKSMGPLPPRARAPRPSGIPRPGERPMSPKSRPPWI